MSLWSNLLWYFGLRHLSASKAHRYPTGLYIDIARALRLRYPRHDRLFVSSNGTWGHGACIVLLWRHESKTALRLAATQSK